MENPSFAEFALRWISRLRHIFNLGENPCHNMVHLLSFPFLPPLRASHGFSPALSGFSCVFNFSQTFSFTACKRCIKNKDAWVPGSYPILIFISTIPKLKIYNISIVLLFSLSINHPMHARNTHCLVSCIQDMHNNDRRRKQLKI